MNETYERQLPLIGESGQNKLNTSWVLIVGAGGIGNIAAKFLASSGTRFLNILDYDSVEKSNLNRQILFNEKCVGKNKAESLAKTIKKINPDISCYGSNLKFDKNIDDSWLKMFDVVLDCTDNLETAYILEDKCLEAGISLVFAKTSKYSGVVTVIKDKPYLRQGYPKKQLNKYKSVFPPIGAVVGGYQANLALKVLLGLPVTDKVIYFDILNDEIRKFSKE